MSKDGGSSKTSTTLLVALIGGMFTLLATAITVIGGPMVQVWMQRVSTPTQVIAQVTPNTPTVTSIPATATSSPTLAPPAATHTSTVTPTPIPTTPVLSTDTPSPVPETPTPSPVLPTAAAAPASTPTPAHTPIPAPSFTGKLAIPVTYGMQPKVYITGFDGNGINGPQPVSLDARQPLFSRDGQSLIVKDATGDLLGVLLTDAKGQSPRVLIGRDSACWPALSPDGSQVMFAEQTLEMRLHRRTSDGAISEVKANNRPILAKNILWTGDNRLVFSGCATWFDQPTQCGVWVTGASTINPVSIIPGLDAWPADARQGCLVYMSAQDGDWDIYLTSLDGGGAQNLTNNSSQDGLAAIAPDGKSVAYISDESGAWGLWTVTLPDKKKQHWFDIGADRGTINVSDWPGERMSWAP